jgi:hypothetical protein
VNTSIPPTTVRVTKYNPSWWILPGSGMAKRY